MTPVASVVIPAHNEGPVIGRCLRALATGVEPGDLDIVVVANACRDNTAEVARAAGARVIETPVAGKARAIVLGDAECRGFPRLYLDADIELRGDAVRRMADTLLGGDALACAPVPDFDLAGASWLAGRFHRVQYRLRRGQVGLSGAGAYMLGERAHARAFPLPDVIADDAFVHRAFPGPERAAVGSARVSVRPPRTAVALVRQRARVRLGNRQLDRLGYPATEATLRAGSLGTLVRRGEIAAVDAGCFLAIQAVERLVASWREFRGTHGTWSADRSSRVAR